MVTALLPPVRMPAISGNRHGSWGTGPRIGGTEGRTGGRTRGGYTGPGAVTPARGGYTGPGFDSGAVSAASREGHGGSSRVRPVMRSIRRVSGWTQTNCSRPSARRCRAR